MIMMICIIITITVIKTEEGNMLLKIIIMLKFIIIIIKIFVKKIKINKVALFSLSKTPDTVLTGFMRLTQNYR